MVSLDSIEIKLSTVDSDTVTSSSGFFSDFGNAKKGMDIFNKK